MNTIPITFEKKQLEYTLIGGPEKTSHPMNPKGFTILLLNRGGKPFRKELLSELIKLNCQEIIFVEQNEIRPDDINQTDIPLHILRVKGSYTAGDIINIGIKEAMGKFIFVLWSDMILHSSHISSRVFEKIDERNHFCTVPQLTDEERVLPSCSVPVLKSKREIEVIYHNNITNLTRTLFPSDYCGIYSREKFLELGGFDGKMSNPYWQLMDLGFRVALWGDRISFQSAMKISYMGDIPSFDITPDVDYGHFFMKTQAIAVKNGVGRLPGYRLFSLLLKTDGNGVDVYREFQQIKSWVRQNKNRFKEDVSSLLSHWEDS
jgi:hypothetical protein